MENGRRLSSGRFLSCFTSFLGVLVFARQVANFVIDVSLLLRCGPALLFGEIWVAMSVAAGGGAEVDIGFIWTASEDTKPLSSERGLVMELSLQVDNFVSTSTSFFVSSFSEEESDS